MVYHLLWLHLLSDDTPNSHSMEATVFDRLRDELQMSGAEKEHQTVTNKLQLVYVTNPRM